MISTAVRLLVQRSTRAAREITRLEHSVAEVRGEERAQLADELSELLVESLDATHASLDQALRAGDVQPLTDALTRTEKATRTGLSRLRGLVSTLRSATEPDEAPPTSLISAIEEIEEVLVGHGHSVELELGAVGPGTTGEAGALVVAAVRAGAEHVRERGSAGAGVTITLDTTGGTARLSLTHDASATGETTPTNLRALQEEFATHGGTLHIESTPTQWRLRITVPLGTAQPVIEQRWRRPWATRIPARVARVVLTIVGVVGVATLRHAGHEVNLTVAAAADDSDPTTQRTVSRILREATTNILRYAPPGSACDIAVTASHHWVGVTVANPLPDVSRSNPHSTGLGLVGLAERVARRWHARRRTGGPRSHPPGGGRRPGSTMPSWIARTSTCVRETTPSLSDTRARYCFTEPSDRCILRAIC